MKKLITIIISIFLGSSLYGQNLIYKGTRKYSATESWEFKRTNEYSYLEVQVAAHENGGYLRLAVDASDNQFFIGGNVTVFLEDGTILTCIDKNIKDHVDGKSVVLYYFTNAEMQKLAVLDIMKIRFTIKPRPGVWGSQSGNYTAENEKSRMLSFTGKDEIKYYDTSAAVQALLEH